MMMYVMMYRASGHATLMEMTAKEYREAQATQKAIEDADGEDDITDMYPYCRAVGAYEAHQWVREGGHHSTYLYVDDGRIRKAKDA